MSVSGSSHSYSIVMILSVVVLGLVAWTAHALWGQMRQYELQNRMRALHLCVVQYASDYGDFCPDDLGALLDGGYCKGGQFFRGVSDGPLPKNGDDIRAGLCDLIYLGKGMKIDTSAKPGYDKGRESASFPLLYLNAPSNGEWLVLYGDGRCEAYETLPSFLKPRQ